MKKLLLLTAIPLFLSCSSDEDCEGKTADIKAKYEQQLDNDQLSPSQRESISAEYAEALENACD